MSRPVLYMLPGLLCDETVFAPQVTGLSDVCDVRVPEFRGLDSFTAMAQRVLDDAPPRFCVAGFSMGGRVAFQIAAMALNRIERFCAFDTGVGPLAEGEPAQRQAVIDLAWREGMGALADAWLPPMLHETRRTDPAFVEPLRAMVMRSTPEQHEKQIRALLNRADARPVLPTIKCPTLIACGRQDAWSPPAAHEAMAAAIPGAKLVVVEECGHFLPLEQPEAFNRALREWMSTPAS
ncbi:MAG: alpha/beta hydrolase [Beijerinckiaceae bacterium]|nr:alpha/beta hydrolase [Beijerinckiaceae bacterium]